MTRLSVVLLGASVTLLGCPSVHTMRGGEVLPEGKSEIVTHVGMNGALVAASATAEGESESDSAAAVLPWAAFSYRRGLGNKLDFQVKTDLGIFPELGVGYQLVGTPGQGGTAISVYAGAKYFSAGAGDSSVSVVYAPLTMLADLPLGSASLMVKGGVMVLGAMGGDESSFTAKPLVGVGARVKMGGLTLLPEVNYMHAGSESASSDDGSSSVSVGGGLIAYGLGFAF